MTIDTTTYNAIQQIQTPALTTFSKIIEIITDPIILVAISIIIATILYLKKAKAKAILLTTTTIATAIIIKLLKEIIQRPRPTNTLMHQYTNILTEGYAFPSGHTTMAIVFLGLITYLFAKKQKLAAIATTAIILIISFTRIYLNVHWLTDVIAGIILGTAILAISITIHKKLK